MSHLSLEPARRSILKKPPTRSPAANPFDDGGGRQQVETKNPCLDPAPDPFCHIFWNINNSDPIPLPVDPDLQVDPDPDLIGVHVVQLEATKNCLYFALKRPC